MILPNLNKLVASLTLLLSLASQPVVAQLSDDTKKNMTLRFVIGGAPGGVYDFSARIVARNMPAYLGANWSVVVSNVAGAGSLNAANFVLKNSSDREPMVASLASTGCYEQLHQPFIDSAI